MGSVVATIHSVDTHDTAPWIIIIIIIITCRRFGGRPRDIRHTRARRRAVTPTAPRKPRGAHAGASLIIHHDNSTQHTDPAPARLISLDAILRMILSELNLLSITSLLLRNRWKLSRGRTRCYS